MSTVMTDNYMGHYVHVTQLKGLSANAVYVQVRKNDVKLLEFTMDLEQIYTRSIRDEVRSQLSKFDNGNTPVTTY